MQENAIKRGGRGVNTRGGAQKFRSDVSACFLCEALHRDLCG
jgi:hypothetical protein